MSNRRAFIFAEVAPHPRDALAAHNVIGINQLFNSWDGCYMSSHYDCGMRRQLSNHATHLSHLAHVDDDRGNSYDVVLMAGQLVGKIFAGREVEDRAGGRDVRLDQHDSP